MTNGAEVTAGKQSYAHDAVPRVSRTGAVYFPDRASCGGTIESDTANREIGKSHFLTYM